MIIKPFEDLVQAELSLALVGQKIAVSVFFIDGLLIDTGPLKMQPQLIPLFKELPIDKVVLTHHHEDHTGMGHWIQRNLNVPIYIHENGIETCEKHTRLPLYRKVFWGERFPFQAIPLNKEFETSQYSWDVIHTPGHADDHVALYNREKKWMFGGDLYVLQNPKSVFAFESIPTIIQSLRTMLTYDFETYICSHAGVIIEGRNEIMKKLNYLEEVEHKVLSLNEAGRNRRQIRKQLFPKSHPMNYLSLFENSPQHLVDSILR